jgi:hypothetical protein
MQGLAALAMLVPTLLLTGGVALAAAKPCPHGWMPTGYGYGCTRSPSPSTPPPSTPPPTTPPPTTPPPTTKPPTTKPPTSAPPTTTPPLPVTGADAGPAALIGGGLVSVGAIFALWATMFVRRNRFQA